LISNVSSTCSHFITDSFSMWKNDHTMTCGSVDVFSRNPKPQHWMQWSASRYDSCGVDMHHVASIDRRLGGPQGRSGCADTGIGYVPLPENRTSVVYDSQSLHRMSYPGSSCLLRHH
jgi:hypothetical protein